VTSALIARWPWRRHPWVPEIEVPIVDDDVGAWACLEEILGHTIDTPYFLIPWPGSLALARAVLDGVVDVRGKTVIDVGAGSGIAAVAAARMGAVRVIANDIDPIAADVVQHVAARAGVVVERHTGDMLSAPAIEGMWMIGDVVSHASTMAVLARFLQSRWARDVVVADSGRPFFVAPKTLVRVRSDVVRGESADDGKLRTVTLYRQVTDGRLDAGSSQ
jgi:predicted nicotinamide N-methyase